MSKRIDGIEISDGTHDRLLRLVDDEQLWPAMIEYLGGCIARKHSNLERDLSDSDTAGERGGIKAYRNMLRLPRTLHETTAAPAGEGATGGR